MFSGRSKKQIESAKTGLWIAHERQALKQMHEQENGSCRRCQHDNTEGSNWRCKECINGGGTMKFFEERKRRRVRHGVV